MTAKTAEVTKVETKEPAKKKLSPHERLVRRRAYIFWSVAVIAASVLEWVFPSIPMNIVQFSVAALALFRLLSLDDNFKRAHLAARVGYKSDQARAELAKVSAAKKKKAAPKPVAEAKPEFINKNLNPDVKQHVDIK
ncbi:hypothetical protein [Lacticaseibacillus zhaodongensis]|uniref:hypothetical protein n=1 Tax=Lacticaseibacillus zhaodongensis TaxID=2668065 RepID=UPI0012D331B4|nr:hypothetical protein [Lacticaseibacillus zhaodongensis]